MKSMKKAVLLVICAFALVTAAVFGTLAYLTDQTEVVNTFTVGKVDITLDEADVDPDGTPIEGADRVTENEYHLIPGKSYVKDPTVTVKAGSEESYVRIIMTIENASAVQSIIDNAGDEVDDYADLLAYIDGDQVKAGFNPAWTYVDFEFDEAENTIEFEFRYKETVDGWNDSGEKVDIVLEPLFDKIVLPGTATEAQVAALYGDSDDDAGDFKMKLTGHAIQAVGFVDTTDDAGDTVSAADNAWAAFDAQHAPTE